MDADGSHWRRLTRTRGRDYPSAWSPDGRRIAFGSQRSGSFDVWVMDADGSGQRRLTSAADQESPVAWLPDGRMVYASFHGDQPAPTWTPAEGRRHRPQTPPWGLTKILST